MKIPIFQIDTFTNHIFAGNPAAVCPLTYWPADVQLQSIAAENNLSETAFFVNKETHYELRWFTPTTEVDLCGHATLAAAFVILNHLNTLKSVVNFKTKSGTIIVKRKGKYLSMDFPCREPQFCNVPDGLISAIGKKPVKVLASSRDYMLIFDSEDDVRSIQPDMAMLQTIDRPGVIITAKGTRSDFVSRFFAPKLGILEDPVTGSAHCTLVPYWSKRLSKSRLHAIQLSSRKGELFCEYLNDRVLISGQAVRYLEGSIFCV
ncbi:MAG: PhzF family phenazine biosynthesis protein [Candidatus Anammoxibacter sp.]